MLITIHDDIWCSYTGVGLGKDSGDPQGLNVEYIAGGTRVSTFVYIAIFELYSATPGLRFIFR